MLTLPININDLLTGRTVEWERLKFSTQHETLQDTLQEKHTTSPQIINLLMICEKEMSRKEFGKREKDKGISFK